MRQLLHNLAHRPRWAAIVLMLAAFGSAALATALGGRPQPLVHDEFSYLLAGDTFAHGRLANPKHPHYVFFETMHIVHDPSYASMYPPGQGMALASGQVITGDPLIGVWFSVAVMSGAIYWMLLGWLPPRWALFGGALVVLKYVVLGRGAPLAEGGYWSQSYFGGAVAAIGGAMLFGALGRILRIRPAVAGAKPSPLHGVMLAAGVALLANTRPFEGMAVSLPVAIVLLVWLFRLPGERRRLAVMRLVIPATIVLVLTGTFMAYYNTRVTGKATKLAWAHHHDQYCTFPIFIWQRPKPEGSVTWNHAVLEEFHGRWEVDLWNRHRSMDNLLIETGRKLRTLWAFYVASLPQFDRPMEYDQDEWGEGAMRWVRKVVAGVSRSELLLGALLTLPLLALPWALRRRGMKLALFCCAAVVLANLVTVATFPHYAAPMTALVVLLIVQGLRIWCASLKPVGPYVVAIVVVITMAAFLTGFVPKWRQGRPNWHLERARVLAQLEVSEGHHLVFMSYGPGHSVHNEWVFNAAEIDAAKVVWARDMGAERNRALIDYYAAGQHGPKRQVWLMHVNDDKQAGDPVPYSSSAGTGSGGTDTEPEKCSRAFGAC